jgi:hypothetical protein
VDTPAASHAERSTLTERKRQLGTILVYGVCVLLVLLVLVLAVVFWDW